MNIYESIAKAMDDIGAVGKNSKNTQQGFFFRGIDAVMNAINPALVKNKIFIVPEILEQTREERTNAKGTLLIYSICKIKYTFYAEDGSSVTATVIGEGMDTGDKATNKAMSIAFKYACFQVFCIPTEEMKDPDEETHEVKPKTQKKEAPKNEAAPKTESQEKEPAPAQAQDVAKQKISTAKVAALTAAAKNNGVAIEKILKLYKRDSLADLNEMQFSHINANWKKIKNA